LRVVHRAQTVFAVVHGMKQMAHLPLPPQAVPRAEQRPVAARWQRLFADLDTVTGLSGAAFGGGLLLADSAGSASRQTMRYFGCRSCPWEERRHRDPAILTALRVATAALRTAGRRHTSLDLGWASPELTVLRAYEKREPFG
jgi:hypothetical protein